MAGYPVFGTRHILLKRFKMKHIKWTAWSKGIILLPYQCFLSYNQTEVEGVMPFRNGPDVTTPLFFQAIIERRFMAKQQFSPWCTTNRSLVDPDFLKLILICNWIKNYLSKKTEDAWRLERTSFVEVTTPQQAPLMKYLSVFNTGITYVFFTPKKNPRQQRIYLNVSKWLHTIFWNRPRIWAHLVNKFYSTYTEIATWPWF